MSGNVSSRICANKIGVSVYKVHADDVSTGLFIPTVYQ